jgi:hypothetical protein
MISVGTNVIPTAAVESASGSYELVSTCKDATDVEGQHHTLGRDVATIPQPREILHSKSWRNRNDHSIQWKHISLELDVKSLTGKVLSTKKILNGVSGKVAAGEVLFAKRYWHPRAQLWYHSIDLQHYGTQWMWEDLIT